MSLEDLFQKYGIELEKIHESQDKNGADYVKNCDFVAKRDAKPIFAIEAKELLDVPPSVETGYREDGEYLVRKDWTQGKIAKIATEAYQQLERFKLPKVLLILNRSTDYSYHDLKAAIKRTDTFKKFDSIKNKIDLYIFVDYHPEIVEFPLMNGQEKVTYRKPTDEHFVTTTKEGKELYEKYFMTE